MMQPARFAKGDVIILSGAVYPDGAMCVDGYEPDGTLLAHPLGGGLQYRFKPRAERRFRVVPKSEQESSLWRRKKFIIEGAEGEFWGWTDGEQWNGWAMPYFEFSEAIRVMDSLTNGGGQFIAENDAFRSQNDDGDENWEGRFITILGGTKVKVYGIGAGSWIWDEISSV